MKNTILGGHSFEIIALGKYFSFQKTPIQGAVCRIPLKTKLHIFGCSLRSFDVTSLRRAAAKRAEKPSINNGDYSFPASLSVRY